MSEKTIRITNGAGWYKSMVGTMFKVLEETFDSYIIGINQEGDKYFVIKEDCIIVQYIPDNRLVLKIKLIPNKKGFTVLLPEQHDLGDWIDLRACIDPEQLKIFKGEKVCIPLGIATQFPKHYEAHLLPRSSIYKKGLLLMNSQGIIDSTYNGDNDQWLAWFYATEDCCIEFNERICQFRLMPIQPKLHIISVDSLGNESRGGFGEGTKHLR